MFKILSANIMDDDRTPILKKSTNHKANFFLCLLTSCTSLSGLLFGYDTRIVSGAKLSLRKYLNFSSVWIETIASGTLGIAAISSLIGGVLADHFGRVRTILISCVMFTIGASLVAFCQNTVILILSRISISTATGVSSMVIPVYIAEIAPSNIRGTLVTINQFFVTFGIAIANTITAAFHHMGNDAWRYMLGLAAIPSLIQFFAFFLLPESPRWLVANGRPDHAKAALAKSHASDTAVEKELDGITTIVGIVSSNQGKGSTLKRIFQTKHVLKALLIGCTMQLFQQFGGFNAIIYYNATIIEMAGISDETTAIWSSTAVGSLNMLFTLIGLVLVDRTGRKCLSVVSMAGMMLSCLVLAIGFQLSDTNNLPVTFWQSAVKNTSLQCENYRSCGQCVKQIHCAYCYSPTGPIGTNSSCLFYSNKSTHNFCHTSHLPKGWLAQNYCPSNFSWIPLVGLAMYIMFFAPGMGPMPWVVNSEIYPTWARATCNSITDSVHWIGTLVMSTGFISLTEEITIQGAFWLYFGVCAAGTLFISFCLPETKGKTMEETEHLFKSKKESDDFHGKGHNKNTSDTSETDTETEVEQTYQNG